MGVSCGPLSLHAADPPTTKRPLLPPAPLPCPPVVVFSFWFRVRVAVSCVGHLLCPLVTLFSVPMGFLLSR